MKRKVGILSLQGAVGPHAVALKECGAEPFFARTAEDVEQADALIIPGGESTTIGKLMDRFGLTEAIRQQAERGKPIYGSCAGMILLAKEIADSDQIRLGLMDVRVIRNSYGRQVDSFESDISIPALGGDPFHGVFIRAPHVESLDGDATTLAELDGRIVMVQQGRLLATAFHPELTNDRRIHNYFISLIDNVAG